MARVTERPVPRPDSRRGAGVGTAATLRERARPALDFIGGRRFRAGEYEPAARDLARAAALAPSPRLLLGWAEASGRAGDWAAAERAYGQLVERAPADDAPLRALAWYGLAGAALQGRDDLAAGRARLEQALALRPDYPEARRLLAQVEAETRRRADAQGTPSR
jgi:tetratricopeptide (TPR) repeat protein